MHRRRLVAATAALAVAPLRAKTARPLRIVVPFAPGGGADILARAIAPHLTVGPGRNVLAQNRPGAGGSIAAAEVARAEPDGNTLLMGHIGTPAVNPSIYPRLACDPLTSFVPVAWVARVANVLVVPAASPVKSLADLVALAKARPGQPSYSSGGNGSAARFTFEYLELRAGIFMGHIPYRGTAPSVTDLVARQVDATFTGSPVLVPHLRGGRLRALERPALGGAARTADGGRKRLPRIRC